MMKIVILSLLILGIFSIGAQAQVKTIKGNYCGSTYGSGAGTFGFRVGSEIMYFEIGFDSSTKRVRFNLEKLKVGDEFIVKYRAVGELLHAKTITGTGKKKRTEPCSLEEP